MLDLMAGRGPGGRNDCRMLGRVVCVAAFRLCFASSKAKYRRVRKRLSEPEQGGGGVAGEQIGPGHLIFLFFLFIFLFFYFFYFVFIFLYNLAVIVCST